MNAKTTMDTRAVKAEVNPKVDRRPGWVLVIAIKAFLTMR